MLLVDKKIWFDCIFSVISNIFPEHCHIFGAFYGPMILFKRGVSKGWQAGESSPFELLSAEAWHEELHGFGFLLWKNREKLGEFFPIFVVSIWGIFLHVQTVYYIIDIDTKHNICVATLVDKSDYMILSSILGIPMNQQVHMGWFSL